MERDESRWGLGGFAEELKAAAINKGANISTPETAGAGYGCSVRLHLKRRNFVCILMRT